MLHRETTNRRKFALLIKYAKENMMKPKLFGNMRVGNENITTMKIRLLMEEVRKKIWDIAELLNIYSLNEIIDFHSEKYLSIQMLISIPQALIYFADADSS